MPLDLTLTPNRSLAPYHMRWVVGGVAVIFGLGALRFLALGAWPVLPFLALDVGALWWAFRASNATGRALERVVLADDALTVTRISHHGVRRDVALEAYWTRVDVEETPLGDAHLFLTGRGRRVRVGGFLSADERREVAKVIAAALSDYRRYSPSTSSMA
ncbi:hypothetical protein IP88_12140 [alpha proteobacterium AAP81b]|nr:hypothetical protein IP88_12140 [alpha proteobacterium AAP81b]